MENQATAAITGIKAAITNFEKINKEITANLEGHALPSYTGALEAVIKTNEDAITTLRAQLASITAAGGDQRDPHQ